MLGDGGWARRVKRRHKGWARCAGESETAWPGSLQRIIRPGSCVATVQSTEIAKKILLTLQSDAFISPVFIFDEHQALFQSRHKQEVSAAAASRPCILLLNRKKQEVTVEVAVAKEISMGPLISTM